MAKLVAPQRSFGVQNRRLVTDDGGAQCCCGPNCCRYVSPSSPCEYANQSNGQSWPADIGEYQECAQCIRFRRLSTGTMHLTVRYLHLLQESTSGGAGGSFSRGSIAVGLVGRKSVCYTRDGAEVIGTCYLEGALYDQLESYDARTGRRYSRDYVRAGTTNEGTRVDVECTTANLPLITRSPENWGGDVYLFQRSEYIPSITNNPIHARWYRFTSAGPWASSNPVFIRNHCICTHSGTNTFCPFTGNGAGEGSYLASGTATISDNGISGSLSIRSTLSQDCFYRSTGVRTVAESLIEYDCEWIRQPCRCAGGPTEFAPVSLPPLPAAPTVTRMSALEML